MSGLGWRSRWFGGSVRRPPDTARWVVLDVETTGLDMHHDHLLAIAATAVHIEDDVPPRVLLADSFEAVLQHESRSIDKANILLHGIGVAEQRAGSPPREVLLSQLAGGFASPLSTMAGLFAAPLRNLGYALSQLRDQRAGA